MREAGNHVITVIGFRTKDLIFYEDRLREVSDELIVSTDDGSYGYKGVVTVPMSITFTPDSVSAFKTCA